MFGEDRVKDKPIGTDYLTVEELRDRVNAEWQNDPTTPPIPREKTLDEIVQEEVRKLRGI
jgi:hypothetical protein